LGVEITDSAYVAVHMSVMTRMGQKALERINKGEGFIPCMHSVGMPLKKGEKDSMWPCRPVEEKYICQFPQTMEIFSYGSGYGGNALLGKKCFSLRIASVLGKKQGWLAEHMLIVGITNPKGEKKYMAAAFPSACGKTNLAMIQPSIPGWKAETVGDDICWMHIGKDGYFHAINPEYGLFGVVPFTSDKTNHNAYEAMRKDTLFTNVALTSDGDVWWEGIGYDAPDNMLDWHGNPYDKNSQEPAAHKNSRFTAPITNCPCVSKEFDSPDGVKISALIFGGRRATTVPLVYEAKSWNHGVMIASSVGSEITAATLGLTLGELRLDPFAMKPFCGYNMAHYFGHWIEMGKKIEDSKRPKIFCVNWFRKHDGKFLWPGYAENSRVLEYIFNRCNGKENFVSSPIGLVPAHDALNTKGLDIKQDDLNRALNIDKSEWKAEIEKIEKFYDTFGEDLPKELHVELNKLKVNLYK
jgi:Phosphoenolpyruvate carboxykinase (GTP)